MEDGNISAPAADAAQESSPGSRAGSIQVEALLAQLEESSREYDKLAAEKAELQDMLLRRQADYDNFRKRVERDRAESSEYAAFDTCKALAPVLDDFERALKAGASEANTEYGKGVTMIHQRLLDVLTKLGLTPIEAAGKPFDPEIHFAVQKEERDDADVERVLDEYQRGYMFKSRLLRPAMVKVAVKP